MIEHLKGKIVLRKTNGVVVSVNGVGYGLELPLSNICRLSPDKDEIELWVLTHVREDALRLFGFLTLAERQLFEILLSVNGIGPKLGLAILSTMNAEAIKLSVLREDAAAFEAVPGVGKRMAEKIMVELKAKLKKISDTLSLDAELGIFEGPKSSNALAVTADVQSALENLGFKAVQVNPLLRELTKAGIEASFNALLKEALVRLGKHDNKPTSAPSASADLSDVF